MSRPQIKLTALLLLSLLLSWSADAGTLSIISKDRWVRVGRIVDGDTFRATNGERIRLLGINTPEIAHDRQAEQVLAHAAAVRLQQLIAGKTVRLAFDRERRDGYGRTLAQVYLMDNTWINALLARQGLAHVYTFEPNHHWAPALLVAEQQAREAHLGIWSTSRFGVLEAGKLKARHIGQFRLITGKAKQSDDWHFLLGRLHVSVPHKYRHWFKQPLTFSPGQRIAVRGVIRTSLTGGYYLALHSPFNVIRNASR